MNTLELNKGNRSIRKFSQKSIPEETIDYILENLRYCHCANNKQVLRFLMVQSKENCDKIAGLVHYAAILPPEIGTPAPDERPTAYIVITKPVDAAPVADMDIGIAAQVITAAAYEKGVASCMVFNFSKKQMNEALQIDADRTAWLVVSLGFPGIASRTEDVKDGDLKYYVDGNGYHVPKLSVPELVKRI